MVTHDALGASGLHHVVDQMQGLAYARAAVNDVAEEQSLALRVPPDALLAGIAHVLQQPFQRARAAMDVADDIVATARVRAALTHWSVNLLVQPSLLRQMA